ncbi:hypothetical protein TTHERM_000348019 (macronuclear) [Tetrahymena thermophila SB210]|uniref:Uncharacterized protein n=1 Tax=Tetrahymena thermophila (strain SB210) TaxID=312017 RepID=W7XHE1_TETTS|nr:hypothetical protein TTHERM_000348019 [Tetrahymena thermophila SB210]EWS72494.1 hypothetical protein TTHERM_000348019 [Tetrahymena thermophila SB210]|eukprot:XP_012654991.1 hypothetical protein TTHERM_000348019 [Tetrahymena thermophila SB210]
MVCYLNKTNIKRISDILESLINKWLHQQIISILLNIKQGLINIYCSLLIKKQRNYITQRNLQAILIQCTNIQLNNLIVFQVLEEILIVISFKNQNLPVITNARANNQFIFSRDNLQYCPCKIQPYYSTKRIITDQQQLSFFNKQECFYYTVNMKIQTFYQQFCFLIPNLKSSQRVISYELFKLINENYSLYLSIQKCIQAVRLNLVAVYYPLTII